MIARRAPRIAVIAGEAALSVSKGGDIAGDLRYSAGIAANPFASCRGD